MKCMAGTLTTLYF